MYLAVYEFSMRCVLGQHDKLGMREQAIYYLIKKFVEFELDIPH